MCSPEHFLNLRAGFVAAEGEVEGFAAIEADEVGEEVFVDAPKGIVVHGGGDFGDLFQRFLEERAGEEVLGLRQNAGELRIVLLDVAHGLVDLRADVRRLGMASRALLKE